MNNQIIQINPNQLYFDRKNPRLVAVNPVPANQEKILNILWHEQNVKELVMSILANGFFPTEALYVVEEDSQLVVIEGNRRLAAVKAILSPDSIENQGMNPYLSRISESLTASLTHGLPVIKMKKREDAWRYIGFKHVNGPVKWDSLAKAEYIAKVHNDYKVSLDDVASQIGDSSRLTRKLYRGLMLLKEADAKTDFSISDIEGKRLYFSHIYTAITYEEFCNYLGVTEESLDTDAPVPTDREHLDRLGDVMLWLYGSKSQGRSSVIRSQNPDLSHFCKVLASPEAVQTLRSSNNLDLAFEASVPPSSVLLQAIVEANISVEKALSKITSYDGNLDCLKSVQKLAINSKSLFDSMKEIYKRSSEKVKDEFSID